MAKGHEAHQQRQLELSVFGKELARRSKSHCELSGASGVPLSIYEIPPVKAPDLDRCLFLSEEVISQLDRPKSLRPEAWRHLNELIWSEIPAVQLMAARILLHLAQNHAWAQSTLDEAYLDDELLEAASAAPLGS